MNPLFRHHHVPGQPDSVTDGASDQNAVGSSDSSSTLSDFSAPPDYSTLDSSTSLSVPAPLVSDPVDTGLSNAPSVTGAPSSGLVINISYDSSVTALQGTNSTLYSEYTSAVQSAVQFFESHITNNMTVTIDFGWNEVNNLDGGSYPIESGAAAESVHSYATMGYEELYNAVKGTDTTSAVQTAALNSLPSSDPTGGATFEVNAQELEALGLAPGTSNYVAATGLGGGINWSWTQSNIGSSNVDAIGALEHEISEDLGRVATGGSGGDYTLLDMFRYTAANGEGGDAIGSAAGARDEPFVSGYNSNAPSYFSYNGSTVTLQYDTPAEVSDGADVADWNYDTADGTAVEGDSFGAAFPGVVGQVSPTDLEEMNVLGYDLTCFVTGTKIATPSGEVPVERLAVGDIVVTHRGECKPVTWIGRGKVLAPHGGRNAAAAVIVRRGALADNVPCRDLHVTKGHSFYVDGVLIPVEFLINHRSIVWDTQAREVEIYHIELAEHDVLLADGAPAESYRDDGNRWLFRNANSGWGQAEKPPCAPVLTGGPVVDAVWKRLLDRSGLRLDLPTTDDPDLHLIVDGRRIDGRREHNGVSVFHLPPKPSSVRIASRAAAQDELGLARDPRLLGVAVRRILVWRGPHLTLLEADDWRLAEGFHEYEADNGFRWTDGEAVLPASVFDGGDGYIELELHVAAATHYALVEERIDVAA